jgi:hypothetical protein
MLKAIRKTFSMKLGSRVFVCLHNDQLPPALRKQVRPFVFGFVACWVDRLQAGQKAA